MGSKNSKNEKGDGKEGHSDQPMKEEEEQTYSEEDQKPLVCVNRRWYKKVADGKEGHSDQVMKEEEEQVSSGGKKKPPVSVHVWWCK